jgi:hypothetical protein
MLKAYEDWAFVACAVHAGLKLHFTVWLLVAVTFLLVSLDTQAIKGAKRSVS